MKKINKITSRATLCFAVLTVVLVLVCNFQAVLAIKLSEQKNAAIIPDNFDELKEKLMKRMEVDREKMKELIEKGLLNESRPETPKADGDYIYPIQYLVDAWTYDEGELYDEEDAIGASDGNLAQLVAETGDEDTAVIIGMFEPYHPAYGGIKVRTCYGDTPTDPPYQGNQVNILNVYTLYNGDWQYIAYAQIWDSEPTAYSMGTTQLTMYVAIGVFKYGDLVSDVKVDSITAENAA